ncbi:lysozyme family protein [Aneurinibacillus sp. Ricciae_BoGa-3]|uniref:lysozyme family protein n=1 Tax=Aneurinibacillus sp. Ricciae_BoGa-3 TaxID=3022697 RepID=UPI00233FAF81|nr:lysozyme family protein [Aneurinibacillus sp. Ricciae_BoGa-3]WCK54872.1 lysozyme family protein [Aneurinibacillus sp. Ricciae_BoGa-3]
MKFKKKRFITNLQKGIFLFFIFSIAVVLLFLAALQKPNFLNNEQGKATINAAVLRYQPVLHKFAVKYGVSSYEQFLLAQMMQESGGQGGDPMQASESLGLPPNTITNPEQSIETGVRHFATVLKLADGDLKLATQSYNFGIGFIQYAKDHGGYSKQNAVAFSQIMAKKYSWKTYGDIDYVEHVFRYYNRTNTHLSQTKT